MGKRGPKPTPTRILQQRGSRRAMDRGPEPEPERVQRPEPPTPLPAAAREIWDQVIPQLDKMGVLTTIDVYQLERYCRLYVRWRRSQELLEQEGETIAIYADEGAVDPAATTAIDDVGLPPKLVKCLAAARLRTALELETAIAGGPLTCYAGIGAASDALIRETFARWRAAHPIERPVKCEQQRVEVSIVNNLDAALRRYEANFGMSAADRVGLQITEARLEGLAKKNANGLEGLLSGGGTNN